MFGFVKKAFFVAMTFFGFNVLNVNSLECVSMKNQECRVRLEIINLTTDEPIFYSYSITINRCWASCCIMINPYAQICFPDIIKSINVKVVNLISRINETRHIKWH